MLTVLKQKARKYWLWRRLKGVTPADENLDQFYFAYGANVASGRFGQNHMHSKLVGDAVLPNYRLEFSLACQHHGMGYASVTPDPEKEVWGVLYRMDSISLQLLDVLEWVNYGYYRRVKAPVIEKSSRSRTEAWVYVATRPRADLIPSSEYLSVMVANSKKAGHPKTFIDELMQAKHQPVSKFELNVGYRISRLDKTRPFVNTLGSLYRLHDNLRQKLVAWLP